MVRARSSRAKSLDCLENAWTRKRLEKSFFSRCPTETGELLLHVLQLELARLTRSSTSFELVLSVPYTGTLLHSTRWPGYYYFRLSLLGYNLREVLIQERLLLI